VRPDELGAVNLLTAERVRAAAQSVLTGEQFSLGLPLHMPDPPIYGREPLQDKVYATMPNITDDRLDSFFPQGSSRWDGLGHFAHPTKGFYNGFSMADVLDRGKVGIHNPTVKGIVGRGVLADVARYLDGRGTPMAPDQRCEIDGQTCSTHWRPRASNFDQGTSCVFAPDGRRTTKLSTVRAGSSSPTPFPR
jgi:hypothetical protein